MCLFYAGTIVVAKKMFHEIIGSGITVNISTYGIILGGAEILMKQPPCSRN
jgi:hypothetical protein